MKKAGTIEVVKIPLLHRLLGRMARYGVPGHGRLASWLTGKCLILANTTCDTVLWLDPRERIDREILRTGSFDDEVIQALKLELRDGDIFWDIGANIGHHCLAVKKFNDHIDVVGFEPHPGNFVRLEENRDQNQLEVNLKACALSDREGSAKLFTTPANSGRTSLRQMEGSQEFNSKVEMRRADSLIRTGLSVPNVLKIDVEGAEKDVLAGFGEYLDHSGLRCVIFEVVDPKNSPAEMLETVGFKVNPLDQRGNFIAKRQA